MSLSGAWRQCPLLSASPPDLFRNGNRSAACRSHDRSGRPGASGRTSIARLCISGAFHGVRRLGRAVAVVPALLLLTLLAGVATQASAQTLPTVSFASASQSAGEGSGTHNVEVRLNPPPTATVTLTYTVGGDATAGSDFTIADSGTLAVPAGAKTATIPVTIIDDSVAEGRETVVLKLAGGTDYHAGSPGTHTLTIADNEPVLSFASTSRKVGEGSGTHDVEVRLSPPPWVSAAREKQWEAEALTTDITVNYLVRGTATAGSDFKITNFFGRLWRGTGETYGTVTVPAGARTVTIPVTIIDDNVNENTESVELALTGGDRVYLTYANWHTLSIVDNDPEVSFASASQSVDEGSGTHNVGVTLSPAPATAVTFTYTVGGTAAVGSDFTIANSGTLTVPAGATTATIPVTVIDDSVVEGSETVVLKLSGSAGYRVGSPGMHTLTIVDGPRVSFASASQSVDEGSGTRDVGVTLDKAPTSDITVKYTVGGTATATIPVAVIDDSVAENSETVVLTLAGGSGYSAVNPRTHALTISASDMSPPAMVSFAEWGLQELEWSGTHDVKLTLDPAPAGDITLTYNRTGGAN